MIEHEGLSLVALSYDSPETLRAFAERQGITYPLLSDPGSRIIDLWGLRNQAARGREVGVPHPGTFILSRDLRVVDRAFEQAYQERNTAAGILARLGAIVAPAAPMEIAGGQLIARPIVSDEVVAPGKKIALIVEVTPKPKMHVYAPGQAGYIPVSLTLAPSGDFKTLPPLFPPWGTYYYAPLKETVKVYDKPFRITQSVTMALSPGLRQRAAAKETVTFSGELEYQACDDKVCYRPEKLPLTWTVTLTPFVR